jgi:carbamate kinase
MTPKQVKAAKQAATKARATKAKADALAQLQKDENAKRLAEEIAAEALAVATETEDIAAEAERVAQLAAQLEKEDPTLWERFKKWFSI